MQVEMCSAYRVENGTKYVVDWDTDTVLLRNEVLSVEFRDQANRESTSLEHDFVSKR